MEKISDAKEGDIPGKFAHLADSSADIEEGHGKKQGAVRPLSKKKKVTNDFYNTPQHSSQPSPIHSSQSTPQQSSQSTPQHSSQSTPQHSSQLSTINSSQSLPKSPHQSSSHLSKVISSTISSASGCPSNIIQVPLSCDDNETEGSGVLQMEEIDCSILWEQLHSSHLMRLWRTGACVLHYKAAEDDEEFDVSVNEFDVSVNEYKLHAVELYIQFHTGNIIEADGG